MARKWEAMWLAMHTRCLSELPTQEQHRLHLISQIEAFLVMLIAYVYREWIEGSRGIEQSTIIDLSDGCFNLHC